MAAPMPISVHGSRRSLGSRPPGLTTLPMSQSIPTSPTRTGRPPARWRVLGMPQLVWASESHTDLVARELGLDPVEFRRKNLLKDGLPQATGTVLKDTATVAVLDRVVQRIDRKSTR